MYVDRFIEVESHATGTGERICLAMRPHWFRAIEKGAGGLVLMGGGIALLMVGQPLRNLLIDQVALFQAPASVGSTFAPAPDVAQILEMAITWGVALLAVVGALLLGWALLDRHYTEYAITMSRGHNASGRIIKVQGVLSRKTVAVPLGKVNDLELYEPLLGRLFGWGNIRIETGNDYSGDHLEYVPDPQGFYQMWKTLLDMGYARGRTA